MHRCDVRIRTDLPARVALYKEESDEVVNVVALGLGGLCMDGWTKKTPDILHIKFPLSAKEEIELYGDIVWMNSYQSALRFCLPAKETLSRLWEYIRKRIVLRDLCPYCNQPVGHRKDFCEECGWYLNFQDRNYLERHLQETSLQRIVSRLSSLNSDQQQRVLSLIDRELLATGESAANDQFVGTSDKILEVSSLIGKIAPTENPVLILGESGTGKELAARAIHGRSKKKNMPLVVINCAAIPETLLESELFGFEKGAFTGAYFAKKGKFEMADGGAIFLDEIGEMPLCIQAKLLRVLEEKTTERLGARGTIKLDVRVIASTNRDLEREVNEGRFRLDLYHRINTFTITLPALRDRGQDKLILAKYYLKKLCLSELVLKRFSKEALEAINSYSWPGNVRELINKISRAIVVSEGEIITPLDLSLEFPAAEIMRLKETKASIEKQRLFETLEMTSYNITKAALSLGVSRPTIYALMKRYKVNTSES